MTLSKFANDILTLKYAHDLPHGRKETWREIAARVATHVVGPYFPDAVGDVEKLIADRKFMPGGRYLYATGRDFHQVQNCLLLDVEDSREGWAGLMERITSGLMTGAGIGIVYSKLREEGAHVRGMGGQSTGPIALMQMVNEAGRHVMQGGARRSAIWAGLHWSHPDVFKFIHLKDWSEDVVRLKAKDFNFPAPMDGTNISVILDDEFFEAYHDASTDLVITNHAGEVLDNAHDWAHEVYDKVVRQMLTTGEPGFSIDTGANAGEHLRNACTEVTSADDNDICNLGSINLARFDDLEEFKAAVTLGTLFLLCGTLYSTVPYEGVAETREKNRRLGLGLMGIHEWLLVRGKPYGPDPELATWLEAYAESTDIARGLAEELGVSAPVKTRAIAPTGTISIIAETTSGIEPVFCTAFKRRYLKGKDWHFQYVVDSATKRLVDRGVSPHDIEDAYDLAREPERRIAFQAWVQQYVDHGISSTLNLPAWGTPANNEETVDAFGKMLINYLPGLRGITAYPDGSRGGQPLTKVDYEEAVAWEGYEYEEFGNENACVGGSCGI